MSRARNTKKIAILTAHEFEDIEGMYTALQLSQAGASIVVGALPQTALGRRALQWRAI